MLAFFSNKLFLSLQTVFDFSGYRLSNLENKGGLLLQKLLQKIFLCFLFACW